MIIVAFSMRISIVLLSGGLALEDDASVMISSDDSAKMKGFFTGVP